MPLRIAAKQSGRVTVVRVDGRLRKRGAAELEKVCQSIVGPLCLDLANLLSVDADGARVISELEARGAAVAGVSPYVDMLLKRANHV